MELRGTVEEKQDDRLSWELPIATPAKMRIFHSFIGWGRVLFAKGRAAAGRGQGWPRVTGESLLNATSSRAWQSWIVWKSRLT